MRRRQPDNRIYPANLGMMILNDKRFVVNLAPGVPFNACIEEFRNSLRCWASRMPLDDSAAAVVDGNATRTETGSFVWNEDVQRGRLACIKGEREIFKVIFP